MKGKGTVNAQSKFIPMNQMIFELRQQCTQRAQQQGLDGFYLNKIVQSFKQQYLQDDYRFNKNIQQRSTWIDEGDLNILSAILGSSIKIQSSQSGSNAFSWEVNGHCLLGDKVLTESQPNFQINYNGVHYFDKKPNDTRRDGYCGFHVVAKKFTDFVLAKEDLENIPPNGYSQNSNRYFADCSLKSAVTKPKRFKPQRVKSKRKTPSFHTAHESITFFQPTLHATDPSFMKAWDAMDYYIGSIAHDPKVYDDNWSQIVKILDKLHEKNQLNDYMIRLSNGDTSFKNKDDRYLKLVAFVSTKYKGFSSQSEKGFSLMGG